MSATSIQLLSVIDLFDRLRNSFDEDRRTREPRYDQLFKRFVEARLLILDEPSSRAADRGGERRN